MPRKPKAETTRSTHSNAAAEIAAETPAAPSPTAVAAEAMRTGVVPVTASRTDTTNRGDARLKAGDVDGDAMANATVGD